MYLPASYPPSPAVGRRAVAAVELAVVLPLIAESAKTLLSEQGAPADSADQTVGVAVPLLYNFPHAGKILSLAFLPFAAWFSGSALGVRQFLLVVSAGPLSLFGNINAAMPFLLDLLHQPDDLFELFSISSVINSRFGSMTSATMRSEGAGGYTKVFRTRNSLRMSF